MRLVSRYHGEILNGRVAAAVEGADWNGFGPMERKGEAALESGRYVRLIGKLLVEAVRSGSICLALVARR
jgi:hypothetical protein